MDRDLIESLAEATDIPLGRFSRLKLRANNVLLRVQQGLHRRLHQRIAPPESRLGQALDARRGCGCVTLSRDPAVLFVHIGGARPLWMVESLSSFLTDRPVLFLLLIAWSLEDDTRVETLRKNAQIHRQRYPRHHLVFLCNTAEEQRRLDAAGLEAIFVNHNELVSEHLFRPLPDHTVTFDAVYNARLALFKRHYLTAAIERVLYVGYFIPGDMPRTAARIYMRRILAQSPHHRTVNTLVRGLPTFLARERVNEAYSQASVGLCLSPVEGAMYASMEYLLAGLPIVNTPNRGGRDIFFDPDYCLTVPPDPRAIRDAVVALRDRAIPRELIRQRTLARVEATRRQSLALIDEVLTRHGTGLDAAAIWPPKAGAAAITWKSARAHIADFLAQRV